MININREKDVITFHGHTIPVVCSAVSSVMYASVNMLDKYDKNCLLFEDNRDEDYVKITLLKHDDIIDLVINNMFDMINDIIDDSNDDKINLQIE